MGLSNLGIFHTAIGVITLGAGIVSLAKSGKINLAMRSGQLYFYGTLITSFTALGLSKHGGFNPGHVFSLLIVILVVVAYYLYSKRKGNNKARYAENFLLSFSFLLSLVPTVNETLTRIPVEHPFAHDATDPLIGKILGAFFLLFIAGSIVQFRRQMKINKS